MEAMLNVSLHGVSLVAGFCGGLRGEELALMILDATAKYLSVAQPRSVELANVFLALRGRLKGGYLEEACNLVPIAAVTERAYGTRSLGFYPGHHWMRRADTSPMCARLLYIIWFKSFCVKQEIIIVIFMFSL
jgi:hypothetical protein